MNCGYFDDRSREYVITDPRTPVKWINYIGTLAFGGLVDHTGGALLCKGDPALERITKYIPQLPNSEFKGETLYLRLREGTGYRLFSPYFVPTLDPLERYECHVGLGYTRIASEIYGIRTDVAIFVPVGGECEIRDYRFTNLSAQAIELDAIPVIEYTHPDALKQLTNADWVPQTMQSRMYAETSGLKVLIQYPFMRRETAVNYLTSNRPASSFETDRARFLGDCEYGTWARPLALQGEELGNHEVQRGDNIGALLHHLGTLVPGETQRLIVQLGQAGSLSAAMPIIGRYRENNTVDAAFGELAASWNEILATLQVQTPDADMNRLLNVHNPRQCQVTMNWSRYLSLYQLGLGARGMGYRDTAQDVMGILVQSPADARRLIAMLLAVQRRNGSALHQFNPLTMIANAGDSREAKGAPDYYGDDHLWVVLATCAYLKETGDLAFLDEVVPYYDKDDEQRPVESGPVRDHLRRAIEFTTQHVGVHGLPLLGFADWNDTVNLRSGAESMFVANLYGKALLEMADLALLEGGPGAARAAKEYRMWYEVMKARFNEHAWDGEWFIRYFDHDGTPLGSRANTHGQIYLNGQSWPVISGFAAPGRGRQALDAAYARLNTRNGLKLSAPGFDGFDPGKGGITTYPPGAKENGGVFLHANPWAIMAEAMLGNGDRAYQYYSQINPASRNDRIEEFECEPYVYPQNILGDEHPQFGLARNSWLTGTASWAYQAATQYILGIAPSYGGLRVDPCLPTGWSGFRVQRRFRGATYEIEVRNPEGVSRGVRSIRVDGRPIAGNILPIAAAGDRCRVEVVMG